MESILFMKKYQGIIISMAEKDQLPQETPPKDESEHKKECSEPALCHCGRKVKKPKRDLAPETRAKLSERAKTTDWAVHLKKFREEHPDVKGRDVMREASKSYERKAKESKK